MLIQLDGNGAPIIGPASLSGRDSCWSRSGLIAEVDASRAAGPRWRDPAHL